MRPARPSSDAYLRSEPGDEDEPTLEERAGQTPAPPRKPPCGLRSTAKNPDPCGSTAGQIHPYAQPEDTIGGGLGPIDPDPKPSPLETLSIAPPMPGGYDRHDWKHWTDEDGDCQDTRQEVLIAESEVPVTFKTPKQCKVLTGRWTCPYTSEVFTDPKKLDVDHMVPLGAAHEAGGHSWDAQRRRDFANELGVAHHLIAVKASANRSKGKKGRTSGFPRVTHTIASTRGRGLTSR